MITRSQLIERRRGQGLSQVALAALVGMSHWRLARIESGRSNPTQAELWVLKTALDSHLAAQLKAVGLTIKGSE